MARTDDKQKQLEALQALADAAVNAARTQRTPGLKEAAVAASRALSDFIISEGLQPKTTRPPCHAGKRQRAEMRAAVEFNRSRSKVRS